MPVRMICTKQAFTAIKIVGYDEIKAEKDGSFLVSQSEQAAKLQKHPWHLKIAEDQPASTTKSAPNKKDDEKKSVEEKKLEEMTKAELKSWLTERGETELDDFNKTDLLVLAQAKAEEIAKKSAASSPKE